MTHASGNATWQDGPAGGTPITAARLEAIEGAIDTSAARLLNVKQFGAKGDVQTMDVSTTAGSPTCTLVGSWPTDTLGAGYPSSFDSISAFTPADAGKTFAIQGAGAAGAPLVGTFIAYVDSTHMTMSVNAGTSIANSHGAPYYFDNWPTANFGTDDSAAFAAALMASYLQKSPGSMSGGTVRVPSGGYYVKNLVLPSGVRLIGESRATQLWMTPGAGANPLISLGNPLQSAKQSSFRSEIAQMSLNGQKDFGCTGRVIDFNINSNAGQTFQGGGPNDPQHWLRDLYINDGGGDCVVFTSANVRSFHMENVYIEQYAYDGLWNDATDSVIAGCVIGGGGIAQAGATAQYCVKNGPFGSGNNTKYLSCKFFYMQNTNGHGFYNQAREVQVVGCESQDQGGYGLILDGAHGCVVTNFISNGDKSGAAWLKGDCQFNHVDIEVGLADRWQNKFGIVLDGTNVKNNELEIISEPAVLDAAYVQFAALNSADVSLNAIKSQGLRGQARQSPSIAAGGTWALDLTGGAFISITMPAGNITIANIAAPAVMQVPVGTEIAIVFHQDGTGGRTVTWGNLFINTDAVQPIPQINLGANEYTVTKWVNNGTINLPVWSLVSVNRADPAIATYTPAAAGTVTPTVGRYVHDIQMPAGNITVAATGVAPVGAEITFIFKQDAAGSRTVTWNAQYNAAPAIPALNTAANSFTTYKFVNRGTLTSPSWVLVTKA